VSLNRRVDGSSSRRGASHKQAKAREQRREFESGRTTRGRDPQARARGPLMARRTARGGPRAAQVSSRSLIRPSVDLALELNHAVRREDEWFDEPDDLDRLSRALTSIDLVED